MNTVVDMLIVNMNNDPDRQADHSTAMLTLKWNLFAVSMWSPNILIKYSGHHLYLNTLTKLVKGFLICTILENFLYGGKF